MTRSSLASCCCTSAEAAGACYRSGAVPRSDRAERENSQSAGHGRLVLRAGSRQRAGEADILAAMATALDCGITHFDTATGYGGGYSERLIGRFLAADPSRRSRALTSSLRRTTSAPRP
ncbi:MAG: aldo/keto reductase [Anaerolineae bacterium]